MISAMTTVLLTGASGYIGKHITLQLLNQGYEVRASVRKLSKSSEVRDAVAPHLLDNSNLDSRLTFIELDLEKDSGWDSALKGIDVLMHTASPFPLTSPKDENDLIYTMNCIRSKQSWHGPFDHLINKIHCVIDRNTSDSPVLEGAKPIEESTWQFQIFYLCMVKGYFALMEYMIPIAKKFYPNEFNWDEVEQLI